MVDPIHILQQGLAALREGAVQAADDILAAGLASHAAEQAAASGVTPAPPAPRAPAQIIHALLAAIIAHMGNKQELTTLLDEYARAFGGRD